MKQLKITNGPSREELFDGLRLASEKRLTPFCVENNSKEKYVAVIINSIQAEDGSGQSWNLGLYISKFFSLDSTYVEQPKKNEPHVVAQKINFEFFKQLADENYLLQEYRKDMISIKAYYSTKTRKGLISFE